MPLAISNSGMVGLGVVAGIFIVFALVVSMWLPRRNPDFPGDRLGAFIAVTVALFLATLAGVIVFAKEEEEGHGAEAAETHATTETGETEPATTGGTETGGGGGGAEGDPAAGEQVFASSGCGGCHTLSAAGSSGNVGPNLDESSITFDAAVDVITNGRNAMPAFGDSLDEQQIRDVAAFVTGG